MFGSRWARYHASEERRGCIRASLGLSLVVVQGACTAMAPSGSAWFGEDDATESASTTDGSTTEAEDPAPAETSTGGDESTGESVDGSSDDGEDDPPPVYEPARYPGGQTHSPITPYVADRMRELAELGPAQQDDVFMKAGASSTVSSNTLHCFVEGPVDLGEHEHLEDTLDFFLGGDAAGTTPFDRETEAARVGHHAGWVISGAPSPLQLEASLVAPRLALVHYGTNDMGWGDTYGDALLGFHVNMTVLIEQLLAEGVVPVLFGITRRGDLSSANRWVNTWNAGIRGIAQSHQIPFVDLHHAIDWLPGHGLAGDGLHLEAYDGGACVLDEAGLQHGYNLRNLVALEALDRAKAVLVDDVDGLDEPEPLEGTGTREDPYVIDALPFTDVRDTTREGAPEVDTYPGCNETNEAGAELWYQLEVDAPLRLRAGVLSASGADIDVHLVDQSATGEGCLERGHSFVESTIEPGVYHFSLDTWTNADGIPQAGQYIFLLVECDDDDAACNG